MALLLKVKGYYMLPEGRKLFIYISTFLNKRYSTSIHNVESIMEDIIKKYENILLIKPPFDISLNKSHLDFVRSHSKVKPNIIYLYDNNHMVEGSPFSSYKEVHLALGLNPGSNTCGRYIDTGRLYKSRYMISTVPK
jgi:hypothetical protein